MTASLILEKLSRVETKNDLLGRESLDRRYSLSIIMNLVLNERGFILLYNCAFDVFQYHKVPILWSI